MAEYYLVSQLPSLDGVGEETVPPITEERFLELCGRFLGKKAQGELQKITLLPPRDGVVSASAVLRAWHEGERSLRLALAKVRAGKMKKPFEEEEQAPSPALLKTAEAAAEMEDPLKAEQLLHRYRLDFLESLRPMDSFSEEFVYYYGLKLKLLFYIRRFNAAAGEAAYKNIYGSILNGDRLEVES